jgi:hypothetical protein
MIKFVPLFEALILSFRQSRFLWKNFARNLPLPSGGYLLAFLGLWIFFIPPWCEPVEVRSPQPLGLWSFVPPGRSDGGLSSPNPLSAMVVYVCLLFLFFYFVQARSFKTIGRGEADLVYVVGGVHGQTFTFIYNFDARSMHVCRLLRDAPISCEDSPCYWLDLGSFVCFVFSLCFFGHSLLLYCSNFTEISVCL